MSDWALSSMVLWLAVSACSADAHVTIADDACVRALAAGTDSTATVAFFTATWSGPDQKLTPILNRAMHERADVTFRKVDIDASQAVATACDVRAIPTLIGVRRGKLVARLIGAVSKERLDLFLDSLSAPGAGSH
jgi:thioredoxin-like negative regulator of GroEL